MTFGELEETEEDSWGNKRMEDKDMEARIGRMKRWLLSIVVKSRATMMQRFRLKFGFSIASSRWNWEKWGFSHSYFIMGGIPKIVS